MSKPRDPYDRFIAAFDNDSLEAQKAVRDILRDYMLGSRSEVPQDVVYRLVDALDWVISGQKKAHWLFTPAVAPHRPADNPLIERCKRDAVKYFRYAEAKLIPGAYKTRNADLRKAFGVSRDTIQTWCRAYPNIQAPATAKPNDARKVVELMKASARDYKTLAML